MTDELWYYFDTKENLDDIREFILYKNVYYEVKLNTEWIAYVEVVDISEIGHRIFLSNNWKIQSKGIHNYNKCLEMIQELNNQ